MILVYITTYEYSAGMVFIKKGSKEHLKIKKSKEYRFFCTFKKLKQQIKIDWKTPTLMAYSSDYTWIE